MRRLALTGGAGLVAAVVLWSLGPQETSPPSSNSGALVASPPSSASLPIAGSSPMTPTDAASSIPTQPAPAVRRNYALGLHELDGLSPDVTPGSPLQIWVAWEPPLTRRSQIQLLLPDVLVVRIVPSVVPEGPTTVLISVPARDISDLLYGDRYGELSAVAPS